jgi:hypothetical protein
MVTLQWFVRSCIVRSFRVSFARFVYRAFVRVRFQRKTNERFTRTMRKTHDTRNERTIHERNEANELYGKRTRTNARYTKRANDTFRSCIVRSFRVSCVFRIVRVKRSFVFRSFRLRLVRIVILYDPWSVAGTVFFLTTRIHFRVKVRLTSLTNWFSVYLFW